MSAPGSRSLPYATAVALGYVALAATYIWLSSRLAADASRSVEELERIELIKGITFVAVTGLATFLGAWFAMRRMERFGAALARQESALVANEGRVVAGLMAASVAHDANNALVIVLAELESLSRSLGKSAPAAVARLEAALQRLLMLNRRLLDTARQGAPGERMLVDLAAVAHETASALRSRANVQRCAVAVIGPDQQLVFAQPQLVHRIVANLVLNAIDACPPLGKVEVRLGRDAGQQWLEVHDSGTGVPRERRAELFEALQTTKATGSGLGLFSVRMCARGLGGDVELDDSPLGGALFRVRLPVPAAV